MLIRTLKPTGTELIAYSVAAVLLLLALNAPQLYEWFFAATGADEVVQRGVDDMLRSAVDRWTAPLNTQLGNSVIWSVMGAIAFTVAVALVTFLEAAGEERSKLRDVNTAVRERETRYVLARLAVRAAAGLALLYWLFISARYVLPWALQRFYDGVTNFAEWYNPLLVLAAVVLAALVLYSVAVLCRLTALKVRVFSTDLGG